jgi:hypothetical protein
MFEASIDQNGLLSKIVAWTFRTVVVINFLRFGLSFFPGFEGTPGRIGLSDLIFASRLGGFRVDFVWLVATTPVILLVTIFRAPSFRDDRRAKFDAILGASWVLAFIFYLVGTLFTGTLYFG